MNPTEDPNRQVVTIFFSSFVDGTHSKHRSVAPIITDVDRASPGLMGVIKCMAGKTYPVSPGSSVLVVIVMSIFIRVLQSITWCNNLQLGFTARMTK